jgi:hypothetical protein
MNTETETKGNFNPTLRTKEIILSHKSERAKNLLKLPSEFIKQIDENSVQIDLTSHKYKIVWKKPYAYPARITSHQGKE